MQSTRGCGPESPGDEQSPPKGLPLLDLAPGGGYLAADIAAHAGGLLHHLFTLTLSGPSPKSVGFWGRLGGGGLFLWPDPSGCPVPGVTRRLALRSADFPRWHAATAVIRSAWGVSSYHNLHLHLAMTVNILSNPMHYETHLSKPFTILNIRKWFIFLGFPHVRIWYPYRV